MHPISSSRTNMYDGVEHSIFVAKSWHPCIRSASLSLETSRLTSVAWWARLMILGSRWRLLFPRQHATLTFLTLSLALDCCSLITSSLMAKIVEMHKNSEIKEKRGHAQIEQFESFCCSAPNLIWGRNLIIRTSFDWYASLVQELHCQLVWCTGQPNDGYMSIRVNMCKHSRQTRTSLLLIAEPTRFNVCRHSIKLKPRLEVEVWPWKSFLTLSTM